MDIMEAPLYFDTNVFIYAIEGHDEYYDLLSYLFKHIENNHLLTVTSELTLAECLVKPEKDKNNEAIEHYKQHIKNSKQLKVVPISRRILINAAKVRSQLQLKLPDAIHMATAIDQNCKTFVTNDKKLRTPTEMQRIDMKDLDAIFCH